MTYDSSDASQISYGYDSQLRVSTYEATSSVLSGGYIRKASYEYFNDSRTKKVTNVLDSGFNQEYGYDSIGRISASASGTKVNSQNQNVMPFAQSLGYNAFGDLTERNTDVWGSGGGFAATYTNGHKDNSGEIYDAAGNIVDATTNSTNYKRWKFDASGRSVETAYRWYQSVPSPQIDRTETILKTYDGDGLDTKRVDTKDFILYPGGTQSTSSTEYYVRSTVLGGKLLTELDQAGAKKLTNVYAGDGVLAEQRIIGGTPGVFWRHEDPLTSSYRKIDQNGEEGGSLADSPANVEYDPLGGAIPTIDPLTDPLLSQPSSMRQFKSAGDVNRPEYGCIIDGEMRKDVGACSRALKHRIGHLNASFDQSSDALAEIGIVAFWNEVSGRRPPIDPDPNTTYGDGGKWEMMFTGSGQIDAEFDIWIWLKRALQQVSCDRRLSRIFGNGISRMATLIDPSTRRENGTLGDPRPRLFDESPENGTAHMYATNDGLGVEELNAFTPPGYYKSDLGAGYKRGNKDNEFQNWRRFYYAAGSLKTYGYLGSLIINFTHIGPTNNSGLHILPSSKQKNAVGSVPVGILGGFGSKNDIADGVGGVSGGGTYTHSHMIFRKGNGQLIDPRIVFCSDLGF